MKYTIDKLLKENVLKYKNSGYIYEKINGEYQEHTFKEFCEDVYRFADDIHNKTTGTTVAIYSQNSYRYMVLDVAVMAYIGISVTLSKEWTFYDLDRIFADGNIDTLVYDEPRQQTAELIKQKYPKVSIININELGIKSNYILLPEKNPYECCKVIFSSGTTGIPKGVMLCQKNMFACWDNLYKRTLLSKKDRAYLFLPLNYTYSGICNSLYSLITGMRIYLCSDTRKILQEIQEIRPTAFCAVPLIYERMYHYSMENNIPPDKMLGGNVRLMFSAGAFLSPEIRKYFKSFHMNLIEAYGLTETASIISAEYSNSYDDFTSCGKIFENVDVKVSEEGELLAKGDNIFLGYFGNDELTKRCFTADGYFKTGDTGLVRDGKIYLSGRKKRVIILSNGENVDPAEIEHCFDGENNINKVKVFEKDKKIHAVFYIADKIDADEIVEKINGTLPKYSRIRSYEVINDSISVRMK